MLLKPFSPTKVSAGVALALGLFALGACDSRRNDTAPSTSSDTSSSSPSSASGSGSSGTGTTGSSPSSPGSSSSATGASPSSGSSTGMSPSTGANTSSGAVPGSGTAAPTSSASGGPSSADRDFAAAAISGNRFEVEASRLALERTKNGAVRKFAQHMVDDHSKVGDELRSIVAAKSITPATEMNAEHSGQLIKLRALQGRDFDREYAAQVGVAAHQETVGMFERAAQMATDPQIKSFAEQKVPALREHLTEAQALAKNVGVPPERLRTANAAGMTDARGAYGSGSSSGMGSGAGPTSGPATGPNSDSSAAGTAAGSSGANSSVGGSSDPATSAAGQRKPGDK